METTTELPTSGQFIMIWENDNKLWSATMRRTESGSYIIYDENIDDWGRYENIHWSVEFHKPTFITEIKEQE